METDHNCELQSIACTLSGSDQGQRVGEWQELLAHGTAREPVPDGIRVTLPAALAGLGLINYETCFLRSW